MGQAKQRKQQLGDAYGTPERSTALQFRYMREDELKDVPASMKSDGFVNLICTLENVEFPVAVKCVIDTWGKFNTYVLYGSSRLSSLPGKPFQGSRKNSDHRAINQFILDTTDVVIENHANHPRR